MPSLTWIDSKYKDRWLILSMIVKEKEKLVVNFKDVITQL